MSKVFYEIGSRKLALKMPEFGVINVGVYEIELWLCGVYTLPFILALNIILLWLHKLIIGKLMGEFFVLWSTFWAT